MVIDIEELRNYLTHYYGTAAFSGMPVALMDVARISHASPEELIRIAQEEHIDLSQFRV